MMSLLHLLWRHSFARLQRARRLAAERQAFDALPPYVLRDLGVDRSEYDSYLAEARGAAAARARATRRRLRTLGP
jgi:hypothetical protein